MCVRGIRMKITVIGGSYFYGRVFVMQAAKEHEVTVVNRGTYSMAEWGAAQVVGDRRDERVWQSFKEDADVVVDFCAYEPGDIKRVLENLPGKVKQYIFISTVDVYRRGVSGPKDEAAPLETRIFPGEAGGYIAGKAALEQEVREECEKRGIFYTTLRPAILYGPYNYAPRESEYIRMAVQNQVLPRVKDLPGQFQFVYVKDAAEAVIKCLLNEKAYGKSFNLCQDKVFTYDEFYEELKAASDVELTEVYFTLQEALDRGIPLPFPVQEKELYSNERSKCELGMKYLDFSEGMARTYRAFRNVYCG